MSTALPAPTPPRTAPASRADAGSGGGRPTKFLSSTMSKLELSASTPLAGSALVTSPAFGRSQSTRIKVNRAAVPSVVLEKFTLEEPVQSDASRVWTDGGGEQYDLLREDADDDESHTPGGAGASGPSPLRPGSDAHLLQALSTRRGTFLTSLGLSTELALMRAHYSTASLRSATTASDGARTERTPSRRSQSPAKVAGSRRKTAGSSTARPSARSLPPATAAPVHSASSASATRSSSPTKPLASSFSSTLPHPSMPFVPGAGGGKALVFSLASPRFPPEEKHELGLCNPVSLYTALASDLDGGLGRRVEVGREKGRSNLLKYRVPRSSELVTPLFVRSIPGMAGLPLASAHSVDGSGFVTALPRRNLTLLNPSSLEPIPPGPGAYLGLSKAAYERGKVAEIGGVERTVTATNGVLRQRERQADRDALALARAAEAGPSASEEHLAALASTGRHQSNAARFLATHGSGGLESLARRQLKKQSGASLLQARADRRDVVQGSPSSFGRAERILASGSFVPPPSSSALRATFIGPGTYDPPATKDVARGKGGGQGVSRSRGTRDDDDAVHGEDSNSGGFGSEPTASSSSAAHRSASFVTSRLRAEWAEVDTYAPLPAPAARPSTSANTELAASPPPPATRRKRVRKGKGGRRRRRNTTDLSPPRAPTLSPSPSSSSTPGPGSYAPALFQSEVASSFSSPLGGRKSMPHLAGFNSSAPREGVGVRLRGMNPNELAVLAGSAAGSGADPLRTRARRAEEDRRATIGGTVDVLAPSTLFDHRLPAEVEAERLALDAAREADRVRAEARRQQERDKLKAELDRVQALRMHQLDWEGRGLGANVDSSIDPRDLAESPRRVTTSTAHSRELAAASKEAATEAEIKEKLDAERHQIAMHDRVVANNLERANRIQSIEDRATHIAQRSLWLATKQRWLVMLVQSKFIYKMWCVNAARQNALREAAAALRIQESWAQFKRNREIKERFKRLKVRLQANMLQYVVNHRVRKKKAAGILVARFFDNFLLRRGEKVFRVVQNFKAHIVTIQRFWRKHFRKYQAALEVNLEHWHAVLHEVDAVTLHHRRRDAAAALAASPFSSPPSPNNKKRSVSPALVAKYRLASPQPSPRAASKPPSRSSKRAVAPGAATLSTSHMNALKELILEKLDERRARIEAELKSHVAASRLHSHRGSVVHTQGDLEAEMAAFASSSDPSPSSPPTAAGESYFAERARYRALFLPTHSSRALPSREVALPYPRGSKATGSGSATASASASASLSRTSSVASSTGGRGSTGRTPLQDHLRQRYQSLLEPAAAAGGNKSRRSAAQPSDAAQSVSSPSHTLRLAVPQPSSPAAAAAGATGVDLASPRPLLPFSPRGRKPLYTPRAGPNILLLEPNADTAQAMRALKSRGGGAGGGTVNTARKVRVGSAALQPDAEGEIEATEDAQPVDTPREGSSQSARRPSVRLSVVPAASGPASSYEWPRHLHVSLSIKTNLLRQVLRESRHSHWRALSAYRHTLADFLTHKLSSAESSIERARLVLTGSSGKLQADQAEYIRSHPVPRLACLLDRSLMKLLILQGFLDQIEVSDEVAHRRAQVIELIQAQEVPHQVNQLFHSAAAGNGGKSAGTPSRGFSNIGSSLHPSPVRLLRMQAQAAAQSPAPSSSGLSSPSLPHARLLDSLQRSVVTIPTPITSQGVAAGTGQATPAPQQANENVFTPRKAIKPRVSPTPTSPGLPSRNTRVSTDLSDAPAGELHALFRAHAVSSAKESFPNAQPLPPPKVEETLSLEKYLASPRRNQQPAHVRKPTMEAAALFGVSKKAAATPSTPITE